MSESPISFRPVILSRVRHDGWATERQRAFIEALLDTGSVASAAKRVGMSTASAYTLRKRTGAADFARAWNLALDEASSRRLEGLMERAQEGVIGMHFYRGRYTGRTHRYDCNDLIRAFTSAEARGARPK